MHVRISHFACTPLCLFLPHCNALTATLTISPSSSSSLIKCRQLACMCKRAANAISQSCQIVLLSPTVLPLIRLFLVRLIVRSPCLLALPGCTPSTTVDRRSPRPSPNPPQHQPARYAPSALSPVTRSAAYLVGNGVAERNDQIEGDDWLISTNPTLQRGSPLVHRDLSARSM